MNTTQLRAKIRRLESTIEKSRKRNRDKWIKLNKIKEGVETLKQDARCEDKLIANGIMRAVDCINDIIN